MMYKLSIDPLAEIDMQESIEWYNNAVPGLGNRFYKNIKSTFPLIQKNPKHFPIRYNSIHTALVSKFPFMIHYKINEEEKSIAILGVTHTSRNPEIWDERCE